MKIRIRGNSIRFRLTKSEVAAFCKEGMLKEQTAFDNSVFIYMLKSSEDQTALKAYFENNTIRLEVPASFVKEWYTNDVVGARHIQSLNDGRTLMLLLEKDFVCMDETFEDQSDNYPNPRAL